MERKERGNVSARLLWILCSPFRFPFKINESFDDINLILFWPFHAAFMVPFLYNVRYGSVLFSD